MCVYDVNCLPNLDFNSIMQSCLFPYSILYISLIISIYACISSMGCALMLFAILSKLGQML